MALRGGESVGRAYVRIYATGDEVPGDIKRIMEESEPSVREAGRDHGRTYAEEFDEETRKTFKTRFGKTKKDMFHDLNESFTQSLADLHFAERYFDGPEWKKFVRRLKDESGAAGVLAGKNLEAEFRDSFDPDALAARMRNSGPEIRRAQKQILDAMYDDAYRMNREFNARLARLAETRRKELADIERDTLNSMTRFKNAITEVTDQVDRLERGDRTVKRTRLMEMVDQLHDLAPNLIENDHHLARFLFHLDDLERRLITSTPHISRWDRNWSHVATTLGKVFGLGSRNNFLNFFGVVVRGMVQLGGALVLKPLQFFAQQWNNIRDVFNEGGRGLTGTMDAFVSVLGSLGSLVAKAAAGLVVFAGVLALIGLIAGPVVAALSMLVGILTAMASSAIMGVIGALAGFGPLLLGAGGAVAGVIALIQTIKDASNATPKLKEALHGVQTEASKLWDTFRDRALADLPSVLERAQHALHGLTPLVEGAAHGFRNMLNNLVDAVDSPASKAFADRFGRFLPHAMKLMGDIAGNTFKGLEGLLRASIPLANDLLHWLDGITSDFADWANSKKGQEQIKDFLQRAADSAESLWDFIKGAFHFFTQLVDKSESTGDDLWTRLGGKFQEWADWIDKHPDAFEQWMHDSGEFAHNINDAVEGLNKLIDQLDSPRSRGQAGGLLGLLGGAAAGLAAGIKLSDSLWKGVEQGLGMFMLLVDNWFHDTFWPNLQQLGSDIWYVVGGQWVGDLFHGISAAAKGLGKMVAGVIGDALSGLRNLGGHGVSLDLIDTSGITKRMAALVGRLPGLAQRAANALVSPFRGIAGRIATAAGNIAGRVGALFQSIPGRVQTVANQMVSRFGNIADRIGRTIGDVWRTISSHFTSIPGEVAGVIDQIVGAFSGLAGRILNQIGHIDLGSLMHGSIDPPGPLGPWSWARGGIADHPMVRQIGEDGVEAVVPLDRPLSQVDPAVRWLSAVAQGLTPPGSGGGKVVKADNWTIVTPSQDPRIVATEVLNELVARVV